jgi:hypothetical protein
MSDGRHQTDHGEDAADVRFGQVLNDFLDRRERGEPVDQAALFAKHPEFAEELRDAIALVGEMRPPHDDIEDLLARGILRPSTGKQYRAQLGPYGINGVLGRGGMGFVLQAFEERLNRTVALKILRPELAQDQAVLSRFEREAKAAAGLQDPHIVAVYAVGAVHGIHFISMEYIDGPSLERLLAERGPLPTDTSRRIFREVLSGLRAAHDGGLVHRDIKPSNILLPGPGLQARIADFGLARMINAQTRLTLPDSVFGTPEYMSPEQARGELNVDHRSDLYSAGVVLYEMLTGRTPFVAEAPSAVVHQILHVDPADPRKLNGGVDPHLASIALRLMAKRPEDRLESAADAIRALDAGEHVKSPEYRRRALLRTAVGAPVLALIVWIGWFVLKPAALPPIREVRVDDADYPGSILARRGNSAEWNVIHAFGPEQTNVGGAHLLDCDGDGEPDLIAAWTTSPVEGGSVFAYSLSGERLWSWDPTPDEPIDWPDCEEPLREWNCRAVAIGNLDGRPGDELVVAARERTHYPSLLAILDAGSGEPGPIFYHAGELNDVLIVNGYFGPNHPALIAWGGNNKLDGYNEPSDGSGPRLTQFDIVQVVMILDPLRMDGLGPPYPAHPDLDALGTTMPWAYGFLDRPSGVREEPGVPWEDPTRTAIIREAELWDEIGSAHSEPLLEVRIVCTASAGPRASLRLDRDLNLSSVFVYREERHRLTKNAWQAVWRPVIQRGRPLTAP